MESTKKNNFPNGIPHWKDPRNYTATTEGYWGLFSLHTPHGYHKTISAFLGSSWEVPVRTSKHFWLKWQV